MVIGKFYVYSPNLITLTFSPFAFLVSLMTHHIKIPTYMAFKINTHLEEWEQGKTAQECEKSNVLRK